MKTTARMSSLHPITKIPVVQSTAASEDILAVVFIEISWLLSDPQPP